MGPWAWYFSKLSALLPVAQEARVIFASCLQDCALQQAFFQAMVQHLETKRGKIQPNSKCKRYQRATSPTSQSYKYFWMLNDRLMGSGHSLLKCLEVPFGNQCTTVQSSISSPRWMPHSHTQRNRLCPGFIQVKICPSFPYCNYISLSKISL